MKIALGLFHFNMHYVAGDSASRRRYCAEAIRPFLQAVLRHPNYRVSFEIDGSSLEILAAEDPGAIALLRMLVQKGQVELISALYSPAAWVAFPKVDIIRAIEINRRVLGELNLQAADIFFSQEAFFGKGLEQVSPYFRFALCKDDYIRYFAGSATVRPAYRLGTLRVIAGSGHMVNEIADKVQSGGLDSELSLFQKRRLSAAAEAWGCPDGSSQTGKEEGLEWYWYHFGSGHHFSAWASPLEPESFFCDGEWMLRTIGVLDGLVAKGYVLGTISQFGNAYPWSKAGALPSVIEGSWNPSRSRGVYQWMGKHAHEWENDPGLLSLAWRSRTRLIQSESLINRKGAEEKKKWEVRLIGAWKEQLLAESSDPLGWSPLPVEVAYGRNKCESALQLSTALLNDVSNEGSIEVFRFPGCEKSDVPDGLDPAVIPCVEIFGAVGEFRWRTISREIHLCEIEFASERAECGVRVSRSSGVPWYCPSGGEWTAAQIRFEEYCPSHLYLPLANGVIGLGGNRALIRVNEWGQIAARCSLNDPWITFGVEGCKRGRLFRWRFFLVEGSVDKAIAIANAVNNIEPSS